MQLKHCLVVGLLGSALLASPGAAAVLELEAQSGSIYLNTSDNLIVHMKVSSLESEVKACQALIGFNSSLLQANSGCIAPGGAIWDDLIYSFYDNLGGELDAAIGVYGESQAGACTDEDSTVAIITLLAIAEGQTSLVFRPALDCDTTRVQCTYLATCDALPLIPTTVNSTTIYIDDTAPTTGTLSLTPYCTKTTTTLSYNAQDDNSGVSQVDVYVDDVIVGLDVDLTTYTLDVSGYPDGVHIVKIVVTDNAGNTAEDTEPVHVDKTPPVITGCPSNITQANDANQCNAMVTWTSPGVSDNCDGAPTLTSTHTPGSTFPVGTTTVTYTATEAVGNTSTCSFDVIVTDEEDPVITTCPPDRTLPTDGSCQAAIPDLVSETITADNCGIASTTQSPTAGTLLGPGAHVVTITATDQAGNTATCTVNVTIADQTPPTVTCQDATVVLDANGLVSISPSDVHDSGSDGCGTVNPVSVTPNAFTCADLGPNTVTLTVDDGNGNTATCTATVTVVDDTPPAVTDWPNNQTLDAGEACDVPLPNLTNDVIAGDNCSYTVTQSPAAGSTLSGLGDHTVTMTVQDPSGNTVTHDVTITITESTAPILDFLTANQNGNSVLTPANPAVQGTVDIYVPATHVGCATFTEANISVDVAGIGPATYVDKAGDVYHFTVQVVPATANGAHLITVIAEDSLGNSSRYDDESLWVNKNTIAAQIELEEFVGASRQVTLVLKGAAVSETRTVSLTGFTNHVASVTLTGVPDAVTSISAKTAWSLRTRLTGLNMSANNGQASALFTGADKLKGGDLDGSNSINVLDYARLKVKWYGTDPSADIDGNGSVGTTDYSILKANWFNVGHPE
ncbi:MAG: hypothetical protein AMXMBFR13_03770 [Phycisphaerae bacterium]